MAVIKITKLTKYYCKVRGIETLDIFVEQGEVFGFVEPRKVLAASGVVTAAMYAINFIVPLLSHSFRLLAEISFLHPYNTVQAVRSGDLDGTAVIIFTSTFIACSAASNVIFRKHDFSI